MPRFTIPLPPLRERGNDILLLAEHFIQRFALEFRKDVTGLDDDVRRLLRSYAFPGNVRELRNLVERGVILGDGPTLTTRELSDLTSTPSSLPAAEELELAILEERAIRAVFEQSGGNQAETARLLGIGTDALRYRLRKHALR